ncbi:hypothetical protein [uncultured Alistipes sp.]|uniref:hypothetical protein n=1 Tax=uncultured Alistipes sp. TaxID=538949 RepID=UPI00272DBB7F|nr:hypothetical protein [uncultured Alistipes sp.]
MTRCFSPNIRRAIHPAIATAPASGYRNNTTGALGEVGTTGRYWSSSTYASGNYNGAFLRLDAGLINPLDNGNRTTGRAVRCVQHLHGPLLPFFRQTCRSIR